MDISFLMIARGNPKAVDFSLGTVRKHYPESKIIVFENETSVLSNIVQKYGGEYQWQAINYMKPRPRYIYFGSKSDMRIFFSQIKYMCDNTSTDWFLLMEPDVVLRSQINKLPGMFDQSLIDSSEFSPALVAELQRVSTEIVKEINNKLGTHVPDESLQNDESQITLSDELVSSLNSISDQIVLSDPIKSMEDTNKNNYGSGGALYKMNDFNALICNQINQERSRHGCSSSKDYLYACASGSIMNHEKLATIMNDTEFINRTVDWVFRNLSDTEVLLATDALLSFCLLSYGYELCDWDQYVEIRLCNDQYRVAFAPVVRGFKHFIV